MTDRDRLIELVGKAKEEYANDITDHTETDYIVERLLNNGVIVPPCKVEDKVWFVCFGKIYPHKIKSIEISEFGMYANSSSLNFNFEHFGKTVFLTKEEAEAKLKELGKWKNL